MSQFDPSPAIPLWARGIRESSPRLSVNQEESQLLLELRQLRALVHEIREHVVMSDSPMAVSPDELRKWSKRIERWKP